MMLPSIRNIRIKGTALPALFLVVCLACSTGYLHQATSDVQRFEQEHVPDKRETVFDVDVARQNGRIVLTGEISDARLRDSLLEHLEKYGATDRITLLPDLSAGQHTWGLVNLSAANLRAAPSHASELTTQATLGTPVRILKTRNDWLLVQTPDRYISWADPGSIVALDREELDAWNRSERLVFTGDFGMLYNDTLATHPVADVGMGSIVSLAGKPGGWIVVGLPDGRKAFSESGAWITFDSLAHRSVTNTEQIVNTAVHLTGRPYLWGGTSARAVDCSGFTKMVYFMQGIILARDASLQKKYGTPVDTSRNFSHLQPGDLLFFGAAQQKDKPEKITHVAISLGGTGYIHSSGSVRQNSLDPEHPLYNSYRRNSLVSVKRIAGAGKSPGIIPVDSHPWYN